jgi:hypothetical protein
MAVVAALLGLVGAVAGLGIVAVLWWPRPPWGPDKPTVKDDPGVLTVSQKAEDGGQFRTISEALDKVEPGMTIRVLDDAVYDEHLLIHRPTRQHGVVLEAINKATIRRVGGNGQVVWIRDVPGVTLRGFRLESTPGPPHALINLTRSWPGVILDQLELAANHQGDCVDIHEQWAADNTIPLVIQNCTMRGPVGVKIEGSDRETRSRPQPCGCVVIRNNALVECDTAVLMFGATHKVQVVGNRILGTRSGAIRLADPLEGAADILVANNTMLRCEAAVMVWDDHEKGKDFLKCKNIRIQNNLVFETDFPADMVFSNHRRNTGNDITPCDLKGLLNSPEWRFGHNWREVDPKKAIARDPDRWIRLHPNDRQGPIQVLSRKPGDANFLRPPRGSPLGTGGAGGSDASLPAYVGAVPPEGVEAWDWDRTWKMLTR